ncbi:hypothetical protein BC936DRAFT_138342 [Jimgerdemannia flammicorona]|uniref:Galactose oxidase n=1 Tax=Jimgerdemannia flammicorona TaxID=994334 RepID=A0A433CLK5_9FUNG|nr:hypothetical protein BC936DRAFT_138342 [Jimgerdemannia flammicorona]
MHRPLRKTSLLLLLAVILSLATVSSATIPEARFAARAVLLNQAIWIYGGVTNTYDKPQNLLWRLDVSVDWDTSNPPYINYTDGHAPAPVTEWGTLFPSADQSAFYSLDVYGPGQTFTFGKYDIANRAWLMFPTTGVTIPNAGPAAFDNKGNTWVWCGNFAETNYSKYVYQFDHKLQLWNSSSLPSPIATREFHTANLLPTGLIIIIGGMYQIQNDTKFTYVWADMADTPTYDTLSGVWRNNTAMGIVPRPRKMHTTTLSPDGYTLIIYGGSAPISVTGAGSTIRPEIGYEETPIDNVHVLNTQTYNWSSQNTTGISPSARFGHTAVQVGWQMIVMGGSTGNNFSASPSKETLVLDTTLWSWLTNYTPSTFTFPTSTSTSTSTSQPIPFEVIVGVVISVLVVVALAAFAAVILLRQRRHQSSGRDDTRPAPVNPPKPNQDNVTTTQVLVFIPKQETQDIGTLPMPAKTVYQIMADGPSLKPDETRPENLAVKPDDMRPKTRAVKPDETRLETRAVKPDDTRPKTPVGKPDDTVEPEAGPSGP